MRRTILLADDSPTIRRLVVHTFADANFRIVEVNNGDAAIKMFEEVQPNVVLADIYMPGKNGYQVCSYVRNHPELKGTPVVLLVGAFDAFDAEAAKRSGATASITKPFEPGALIDLVTSILPPESHEALASREPKRRSERQTEPPPRPLEPTRQPEPQLEPPPVAERRPVLQSASQPAKVSGEEAEDVLGLESIFRHEPPPLTSGAITEDEIERIADRVIQRLSTQVIESIAWDIVPDITEKIVREEIKRAHER